MARGRMISRTLGSSRKFASLYKRLGKLSEFAQTLFTLLVSCADDFGRQSGDAFTVQKAVFPSSPRRESDFVRALTSLHNVRLIDWYEVDGQQIIQIVKFDEHQIGLSKRTTSSFPQPSGNFREIPELPASRARAEENRTEGKGTEGKGRELNGTKIKSTAATRRDLDSENTGTFGLYCVIAKEAIAKSVEADGTDNAVNVAEHFKQLCAKSHIDYDGRIAAEAVESCLVARVRRA